MGFFGKRFREATQEFLSFQAIYGDSRHTTHYNVRVLTRFLGDMRIAQIDREVIESMIAARLQEGVARSTINRQRATLSRFFTWAISRGYHPGPNPVRQVQKFRESPGRTRYLTPDEANRLILAAAVHLKPIIVAALHCGGRLGELLALCWADVDFERGILIFRKESTKSRRERIVPMSAQLVATLRSLGPGRADSRIFQWRGQALRSIRTAFAAARKKADLGRDVLFYTLRHTFASWAVMNGLDIYRLQRYMGHSTIGLTQRYAHLSDEYVRAGVQFLGPPTSARRAQDLDET